MTENSIRSLPLRTCAVCGGSFFRVVEVHRTGPPPDTPVADLPMWILVCLCGAPQRPSIGGIRGGRTPNVFLVDFVRSLEAAERCRQAQSERSAIWRAAEETLIPRERMQILNASVHRLERRISRRNAAKDADGKIRGGVWRQPILVQVKKNRDWRMLLMAVAPIEKQRRLVAEFSDQLVTFGGAREL